MCPIRTRSVRTSECPGRSRIITKRPTRRHHALVHAVNSEVPLGKRVLSLHLEVLAMIVALSSGAAFAQAVVPATAASTVQGPGNTAQQQTGLSYGTPGTHITVLENTLIRVTTDQPLSTKHSKDGMPVTFSVSEDVIVGNVLVVPRGATVRGEVIRNKKAGVVSGSPELTLKLDSLELGGESYPLYTYQLNVKGASKTKPNATQVEGGAVVGALAGAVVNGSTKGSETLVGKVVDVGGGAAIGAGAVEAVSVVSPRPVVNLPAESQMDFYLASPISVQPVSAKEVKRLAQRVDSDGPALYIRGDVPQ